ncbi:MAG TPA: TlpA disulfide reductase family protein [Vicinamibacterales bacterium]|nr:TlpA disulfide reductase family protein [Vicinamibacterales bacterium]
MEEVPLLNALHTRYAGKAVIVGISIDTDLARTDRTVKEKGMTYPVLADGKGFEGAIPNAYHVQGTPDIYVIDREGKIAVYLGSAKTLEDALKKVLENP